jgi:Luciferase-like monooxygenase
MLKLGYKLMSEEHGPAALVRNAQRAEQAGFDFAAMSDHFFPWLEEQGHAPLAWSVLGAVANATRRIGLMTAVTCPTMRYHPAIIAQGTATMALLSNDRFTLGLGAGERLNEHIIGTGWPGRPRRTALTEFATSAALLRESAALRIVRRSAHSASCCGHRCAVLAARRSFCRAFCRCKCRHMGNRCLRHEPCSRYYPPLSFSSGRRSSARLHVAGWGQLQLVFDAMHDLSSVPTDLQALPVVR